MHDIDSVRFETEAEFEEYAAEAQTDNEGEAFEFEAFEFDEYEGETPDEDELVFSEAEEMELAGELLDVESDQELDQFLGKLIRKVGRRAGRTLSRTGGRALGGLLKGAARRLLPGIGSAVGGYFGGATGARFGRQGAAAAGRWLGLELEGLSGEDQEFEVARRVVRLSGAATKHLLRSPAKHNMAGASQQALKKAFRRHAPGLLPARSGRPAPPVPGRGQSGRWRRRGNKIIVMGL